jgi:hypothetical protein
VLSKSNKATGESIMSSTKNIRLVRFLKGLMDFLFWAMIFAIFALLIWVALMPLISRQFDFIGSASIPVRIGKGSDPQLDVTFFGSLMDEIGEAYIEEGEGTLFLETDSMYLIAVSNAAKLIFALGLLYVFHLMRKIMQTIADGDPFTIETGQRIRRLGYALLAVSFLGPGAQNIAAREILNRLPATTPELVAGPTYNAEVILASLLILLLSKSIWICCSFSVG